MAAVVTAALRIHALADRYARIPGSTTIDGCYR